MFMPVLCIRCAITCSHFFSESVISQFFTFKLYNFSKKHPFEVNCVIIDEAGQLALSSTALVVRSLSSSGRIIIAGDSEQLAPILTAQYPQLETRLFGSILDCLMHLSNRTLNESDDGFLLPSPSSPIEPSEGSASQISAIVQLTENFRCVLPLASFPPVVHERICGSIK
jgi:hypothetical protein